MRSRLIKDNKCEDCGKYILRQSFVCKSCSEIRRWKRPGEREKVSMAHMGMKKPWVTKHLKGIKRNEAETLMCRKAGKSGAEARWKGHVKVVKERVVGESRVYKYEYKYTSYSQRYRTEALKERKRFTSMRYKIRKRLAEGTHTFKEWQELKIRYGNMCLCCGKKEPEGKLTEDHVIPLSKGGTDYISNIQPLCLSCNVRKHNKTLDFKEIYENQMKSIVVSLSAKGGE